MRSRSFFLIDFDTITYFCNRRSRPLLAIWKNASFRIGVTLQNRRFAACSVVSQDGAAVKALLFLISSVLRKVEFGWPLHLAERRSIVIWARPSLDFECWKWRQGKWKEMKKENTKAFRNIDPISEGRLTYILPSWFTIHHTAVPPLYLIIY